MAVGNYLFFLFSPSNSQQYQQILLATSMSTHQVPQFPQNHLSRHRSLISPHSNADLWPNLPFGQSSNHSSHFNGTTFHGFAEIEYQRRDLQSEKNIPAPIEMANQGKNKRNTFPPLQLQMLAPDKSLLPSSSTYSPLNRKITFTYRSPTNNSLPSRSFFTSFPHHHQQSPSKANVFQFSKTEAKKIKNKLSSLEFSFIYIPKQKIKQDPYFIEQNVSSSLLFLNKEIDKQSRMINESKMASTIATQSFNQNRRSDFPLQQNFKNTETSKIGYFGPNQKPNLMDQIPKAKQLGDTVFLTNNDYSFGGIINKGNYFEHPNTEAEARKGILQQCELRQWSNPVKFLIDHREGQDLKHSIHEGPQIRLERHKFEMLDGFGREIKESTMSIHQ